MAWRLKIIFDNGDSELLDDLFDTEQDAVDEYNSWCDNWAAGRETLQLAGEDYVDAEIETAEIWEE